MVAVSSDDTSVLLGKTQRIEFLRLFKNLARIWVVCPESVVCSAWIQAQSRWRVGDNWSWGK